MRDFQCRSEAIRGRGATLRSRHGRRDEEGGWVRERARARRRRGDDATRREREGGSARGRTGARRRKEEGESARRENGGDRLPGGRRAVVDRRAREAEGVGDAGPRRSRARQDPPARGSDRRARGRRAGASSRPRRVRVPSRACARFFTSQKKERIRDVDKSRRRRRRPRERFLTSILPAPHPHPVATFARRTTSSRSSSGISREIRPRGSTTTPRSRAFRALRHSSLVAIRTRPGPARLENRAPALAVALALAAPSLTRAPSPRALPSRRVASIRCKRFRDAGTSKRALSDAGERGAPSRPPRPAVATTTTRCCHAQLSRHDVLFLSGRSILHSIRRRLTSPRDLPPFFSSPPPNPPPPPKQSSRRARRTGTTARAPSRTPPSPRVPSSRRFSSAASSFTLPRRKRSAPRAPRCSPRRR